MLSKICEVQAQNYGQSGGGVPDLIVWSLEQRYAKFVEVKGPGDTLSETQKVAYNNQPLRCSMILNKSILSTATTDMERHFVG